MERRRVRIRFRKDGDLRLIGHLDLVRAWERMLRRAGVSLAMTEGFTPRPRMNFPSALAMGEAGREEVVEVDFCGEQTPDELRSALARTAPAGLVIERVEEFSPTAAAAVGQEFTYEFPLPPARQEETAARVATLLSQTTFAVGRENAPAVDLRDLLVAAEVAGGLLRFRVRATRERGLRARDVLAAVGLGDLQAAGNYPTRSKVELA